MRDVMHTSSFLSTTWDHEVAHQLTKDCGSICVFNRDICDRSIFDYANVADVSWISKFAGEKEILWGKGLPIAIFDAGKSQCGNV